jgi:hypothetical protein
MVRDMEPTPHDHLGDSAGHSAGHDATWQTAISATLHCLTGCAIGEVLGMVLATWWGWANVPSIVLAVVLAFFFGYLLTFTSVRRHGLPFADAIKIAVAADTVSTTCCSGRAWPRRW